MDTGPRPPGHGGLRFRRILVPVDFSTPSSRAVRYAAALAAATGADLCLVHVAAPAVNDRGVQALAQEVRDFTDSAGVWRPSIQVLVRYGTPTEEILGAARQTRADLIVMAARSLGRALPAIIGTTTRGVLRSFRGLVITLGDEEGPVFPPRRLTYLMSGTSSSRRAFEALRPLALACHPHITLLGTVGRHDQTEVRTRLEYVKRHLIAYTGAALEIDMHLVSPLSLPARLSLETDLIVLGRNDPGQGFPHLLSPTVRRIVRHAGAPVLSVASTRIDEIDQQYRTIARNFTLQELSRSSSQTAEMDQMMAELAGIPLPSPDAPLLLGIYGDLGLLAALEQLGVLRLLRSKGFDDLHLRIGRREGRDLVQLFCGGDKLVVEVVEHITRELPPLWMQKISGTEPLRVLNIEWVLFQNPYDEFSPERPPLPGQARPGLGLGYEMAELFVLGAERLACDGLWNSPQYYHNARLYHERFHFVDPAVEGMMLALERDTAGHTLAEASWAIELGLVRSDAGPFAWQPQAQLLPISERAQQALSSPEYRKRVLRSLAASHFTVDWDRLPPVSDWSKPRPAKTASQHLGE